MKSATSAYFSNAPVGQIFGDIAAKMKIPPIGLYDTQIQQALTTQLTNVETKGTSPGQRVQRRARRDQADHRLTTTGPPTCLRVGRRVRPVRSCDRSSPGGRKVTMTVVSQQRVAGVRRATKPGSARGAHRLPGSRIAYVYVLPFFVVFLAFSVYPWLDTAWVSLHDTRLSTYDQSSFIGLDNYRNLFTNQFFWNAFRNTITIGIISTVPQLCMALGIAHLLNYRLRGRTFFRVAMLMPYATSLAAATVIFVELFDPNLGLINWVPARRCTCRRSTGRARSGPRRSPSRRSSPGAGPATTR